MTLGVVASLTAPGVAYADDSGDGKKTDPAMPCEAERQALRDVNGKIDEHNSRSQGTSSDQAYVDSFNAEANQLNGEGDTAKKKLDDCIDAVDEAFGGVGDVDALVELAKQIQDEVKRDLAGIPKGWKPPAEGPFNTPGGTPPSGGGGGGTVVEETWTLPAASPLTPLRDTLAKNRLPISGYTRLANGRQPSAGDPDPAFVGGIVATSDTGDSGVRPDDLVSTDELVTIPGFTELSPSEMLVITSSPAAREWVTTKAAMATSSPSVAALLGLDPNWLKDRETRRQKARDDAKAQVDKLMKGRHG